MRSSVLIYVSALCACLSALSLIGPSAICHAEEEPPLRLAGHRRISDDCGSKASCDGKAACDAKCCGTCYLFGPDEAWELMPGDNRLGLQVGGWAQLGYHSDFTPLSTAATRGQGFAFNDVPDGFNLHQNWLYAEKVAESDGCCWDWGFRADLVYGTDAQKTQAFGGNGWDNDWDYGVYGLAIPQLYAEFARASFHRPRPSATARRCPGR